MTKHTDLIERLTDEAYEWSRYVTEDRAPSTLSDYLEPHIKAVANALEAQAREIEGLRKDAERYAVVRRGQHWSVIDGIGDPLTGDRLDAGIDAVIAEKGKP